VEEQGPAGGAERQVAELVEDDEIGVGEPGCDLARFALKLLLFKSVVCVISFPRARISRMVSALTSSNLRRCGSNEPVHVGRNAH
jgi:hypothetical protein